MHSVGTCKPSQSCCGVLLFQICGKSCSSMFMTQTVTVNASFCACSGLLDCPQKCIGGLLQLYSAMSRPKQTRNSPVCVTRRLTQLTACNMQRPRNVTDAMAMVLHHWMPWQTILIPFHSPHGYISAGLPDCEPEKVCPDIVVRLLQRRVGDVRGDQEWEKCMQTAIVSSMCWLHSAGTAGLETILTDIPMTIGYDALVQSVGLIRNSLVAALCMKMEKSPLLEVLGCSEDLPTQTSRYLLQLLSVHVMQLCIGYQHLAATTTALQWHTSNARKRVAGKAQRCQYSDITQRELLCKPGKPCTACVAAHAVQGFH